MKKLKNRLYFLTTTIKIRVTEHYYINIYYFDTIASMNYYPNTIIHQQKEYIKATQVQLTLF